MINFIDLFNAVSKTPRPSHCRNAIATSMSDSFEDIGIDSLDGLVMMMYLTDVYGVSEEVSKGWVPTTLQEIYDLLMAHKTKEPTSIDDVIDYIK